MKKKYRWQTFFQREKLTLFVGCLLLFLGAIYPWYQLPPQSLAGFETNLVFTNIGRIFAGVCVIIGLVFTFKSRISYAPRLIFWIGLIATLNFPYFIVTFSPSVAFLASSYYEQGEYISHHINNNFSEVQAQWKQEIFLDKPEAPPSTLVMSIPDSRFFQMSSWDKVLLEGFGYKNSFFIFIGKGWSFTVFGLVISLIGLYLGVETLPVTSLQSVETPNGGLVLLKMAKVRSTWFNPFLQDMSRLLPGTFLFLAIILFSIIGINILNYNIDVQFAKGEYHQVVTTSKTLVKWYPALQGNLSFLERLAKAEFYTETDDLALINFVKGLENYRNGDFISAETYWRKSVELEPERFLFRGYLVVAMLNQGVSYLNNSNNRKAATAADIFERVLQIFPGHVEALYDLMLAKVVNGEFQQSAAVAKQIIDEQQYFQEQKLGLLGQAYLHLAWAEYNNGDVNKTWERYRQSIDMKTWGNSTLKEQQ